MTKCYGCQVELDPDYVVRMEDSKNYPYEEIYCEGCVRESLKEDEYDNSSRTKYDDLWLDEDYPNPPYSNDPFEE